MSKPTDLVQGTLALLLLNILALEPLHAWAVSQRLKQVSGDVLQVSDGSLYPALHKLEQEGWVTAEWKVTENGRRAKFYSLTRPGRRALEREAANWERLGGSYFSGRSTQRGIDHAGRALAPSDDPPAPNAVPTGSSRTGARGRVPI